jgi:hypothetical protein
MSLRKFGVEYVSVTASTTTGPKTCVPAAAGFITRVLGCVVSSSALQSVTLQSSTGLVQAGPWITAAGVPLVCPPTEIGYAETASGRGIYAQLDNAVSTCINLQCVTFRSS